MLSEIHLWRFSAQYEQCVEQLKLLPSIPEFSVFNQYIRFRQGEEQNETVTTNQNLHCTDTINDLSCAEEFGICRGIFEVKAY